MASEGEEIVLGYALAKVSLHREIRLSRVDLSIVRVALARAGARLLPAALIACDDDRARVSALLEDFSRARGGELNDH